MEPTRRIFLSLLMATALLATTATSYAADAPATPSPEAPPPATSGTDGLALLVHLLNAPPTTIALAASGHCGTSGECNFVECDIDCPADQTKECTCTASGECGPFWDKRPVYDCQCRCYKTDPPEEPDECPLLHDPLTGGCIPDTKQLPEPLPKDEILACATEHSVASTQSTKPDDVTLSC